MNMGNITKFVRISLLLFVLLLAVIQEVESRRTILRGRKTITRWYLRGRGIPGWAVIVIVGVVELLVGGLLYLLLKVLILDRPISKKYASAAPLAPPLTSSP